MATTTFPMNAFDAQVSEIVQEVTFIQLGVNYANKMTLVLRLLYKAVALSFAFSETLKKQQALIDRMNGTSAQSLNHAQLADMAEKIEHLVELNDTLLNAGEPRLVPWTSFYARLRAQRDNLESIAESYRCASDFECESLLAIALEAVHA